MHGHASKISSQSSVDKMTKCVALVKLFTEQDENYSLHLYVMFFVRKGYMLSHFIAFCSLRKCKEGEKNSEQV
jgi:hypothetical protein